MKLFMESNNKIKFTLIVGTVILTVLTIFSFFVGRYPLTLSGIISGDPRQWQVFVTLRASRGIVGCIGGFVLGVAGFVFQTVFRNPLASPDIIGVSSGASAGAAFGILFLSGSMAVTASAFAGALGSVVLALMLASLTAGQDGRGIVLAGIAVHSLAQTALIFLKLLAFILGNLSKVFRSAGCAVYMFTSVVILILSALDGDILTFSAVGGVASAILANALSVSEDARDRSAENK